VRERHLPGRGRARVGRRADRLRIDGVKRLSHFWNFLFGCGNSLSKCGLRGLRRRHIPGDSNERIWQPCYCVRVNLFDRGCRSARHERVDGLVRNVH
jgi:hypothetical protein